MDMSDCKEWLLAGLMCLMVGASVGLGNSVGPGHLAGASVSV